MCSISKKIDVGGGTRVAHKSNGGGKGGGKGGGRKGSGLPYMLAQAKVRTTAPACDFNDCRLEWFCINDVVMGGRSEASCSADEFGCLIFQGVVSTVGGGFASCRTADGALGFTKTDIGLRVTYTSDGCQYKVNLSAGSMHESNAPIRSRDLQWGCPLPAPAGRRTVDLPFTEFRASVHGQPMPDEVLDAASLQSIGLNCSIFDMEGCAVPGLSGGPFVFKLEKLEVVRTSTSGQS